ncbi:MAG: carboxypeptidase-like regulatory domain-containing protein, partial [Terracidiphilus sp.]
MKGFRISFVILLLPALLGTRILAAQAALCGVVHDATGAVMAGAQVTLEAAGGSQSVSAVTGDEGGFCLTAPAGGAYTLKAEAAGFLPYSAPIQLPVAAESRLEIALKVAPTVQTVEVTADALVAETTSTQLGETLDHHKIEAAPLNGRSFTDLMAVQPGIAPQNTAQPGAVIMTGVASTPPSGDANPGNLSISGQRESSNGFRVNGSDVEEDVNMGTSILPNLDSIESFRVLTSNFDAEFGNSSGGQVLVVTRAGEERVHGSAFEFLRNTALDARNYFSGERAAFRQNQFGGTLGGEPLDRGVALFADYQGTRLTEGIDTGNIAVPSLAERVGVFA